MPPTAHDFRRALTNILDSAEAGGKAHIDVNAGELHRQVGDYPGNHRLPICCQVMRSEMQTGDVVISSTPSGIGASVTIRYKFPRNKGQNSGNRVSSKTLATTTRRVSKKSSVDIKANVTEYLKERHPDKRYASFDYCYNYFRRYCDTSSIRDMASSEKMQSSCLQLGFYLASWGMLRGSSFLLQKSVKHYEELIDRISKLDKEYWQIDVDSYSDNIDKLLKLYDMIGDSLGDNDDEWASATLVTKIMLGVFANVPALDENFCKGLGFSKYFSRGILERVAEFYRANKSAIDSYKIKTLDYSTGRDTSYSYSKAKIIDMVGFIEGLK